VPNSRPSHPETKVPGSHPRAGNSPLSCLPLFAPDLRTSRQTACLNPCRALENETPGFPAMRLPPFALVNWFAAAEGRFDLSLSHSDCEPLSVSDLFNERELVELGGLRLGYGAFAGLEQLRNTVAR